jgi:hypothetical protein
MSHYAISDHTCHFPHFISLPFGFFGCTDPRRGCPSLHGKKGMKEQRLMARKR